MTYVIVSRDHWTQEELNQHSDTKVKWIFGD